MEPPKFLNAIPQEYILFSVKDNKKVFDATCFGKNYSLVKIQSMKKRNQQIGIMYNIKDTPFVVVDIDSPDYSIDDLFNDSEIDSTYVKGNTKGFHVWMYMPDKTEEHRRNKVNVGINSTIDFLGEKVFETINKEWTGDTACTLDQIQINKTFKSGVFEKRVPTSERDTSGSSLQNLTEIIKLIDIKYCDNRESWVKLVLAMRKVGFSFEFGEAWSKQSASFTNSGFDSTWDSYTSIELITVGEATIHYYAKKSNSPEYTALKKLQTCRADVKTKPADGCKIFSNDADVADFIMTSLKDSLVYCDSRMYIKKENCWISDPIDIKNELITFIMNANICSVDSHGNFHFSWKNYGSADQIYKTIGCRITESSFDKDLFHTTTKYRLAFKNGVLDFKTKKFYQWSKIDFPYYTTNIIKTDYIVDNDFEILVSKVFEPIFGDKTELALKYIARAIAGCIEDKNFATYMGNRNCGKGALFQLLGVFGSYVQAFNLECLKEDKKNTGLTAREYYWMLPLEFARLAISQEVPKSDDGCVLRSDLLKKICSGGDTLTARRNYDRKDTQFTVECSLFCLGNDEITTHGDVNEHRLVFEGATSFVSQDQYDAMIADGSDKFSMLKYRIADDNIKNNCKDWSTKIVALLLDRFVDKRIVVLKSDIEDQEDMSPFTKLLESYEITGIASHFVLGADIHDIFGKKVKAELKTNGVQYKKMNGKEYRDKYCYVGLRARTEPEEF